MDLEEVTLRNADVAFSAFRKYQFSITLRGFIDEERSLSWVTAEFEEQDDLELPSKIYRDCMAYIWIACPDLSNSFNFRSSTREKMTKVTFGWFNNLPENDLLDMESGY